MSEHYIHWSPAVRDIIAAAEHRDKRPAPERHEDSLMCQAETRDECDNPNHWTHEPPSDVTEDELAKTIWTASRADESTISATGANIVARAVLAAFHVTPRADG